VTFATPLRVRILPCGLTITSIGVESSVMPIDVASAWVSSLLAHGLANHCIS